MMEDRIESILSVERVGYKRRTWETMEDGIESILSVMRYIKTADYKYVLLVVNIE